MNLPSLRFFVSCTLALGSTLVGQRIHVDTAAAAGGDGSSWARAHRTLQPALAQATAGSEVWVAQGTYSGSFSLGAGVTLRGGFRTGATSAGQAQPFVWVTRLDGGGTQRVLRLGDTAVLDGVVLQNGNAPAPGGGGALIDAVSPTVRRCVFTQNRNSGGRGAALSVRNGANPQITDCLFFANANTAHTIDVDRGASGTYDHITVVDNPHNGLHMQDGAGCVITNSMFVRNGGRGICDFTSGAANQPTLHHNLFWQNTVSLMHYRGQEFQTIASVNALSYAQGNLSSDPGFVGGSDYRLAPGSIAIDAGTGNPGTTMDAFGYPRALDGDLDGTIGTDIGFHEFSNATLTLTGNPQPGSTLTFAVGGQAGLVGALALGLPGGAFALPPFGTVYGTPVVVLPLGALPANLPLPIPLSMRGEILAQAVGANATAGNLSNAIEVRIQ